MFRNGVRGRFLGLEGLESRCLLDAQLMVDAEWLDQHGPAPYVLTEDDTTFVLQTDITAQETAIVIGGKNITLDLNGHTVTYDDGPSPAVANGGFELGLDREAPGWDLTRAPEARLAPNDRFMFGDQVLRIEDFSTTQTIVSDPIVIPTAGHTYVASITPAGRHYTTVVTLTVIDQFTGDVLARQSGRDVHRGRAVIAGFTPTTTNSVRLQVEVTPPPNGATTVMLDHATVLKSFNYGILASTNWSGAIHGFENLTPAAQDVYRNAENFTIKNGSVIQGRARSYGSSAFHFSSLENGVTVENVDTFVWGMNSNTLAAPWLRGDIVVRNSNFTTDLENIGNRMALYSVLDLRNVSGNVAVENNTISGVGQVGIKAVAITDHKITIEGNQIYHESLVTNGYGIMIVGVDNVRISNNIIVTKNGRGIMIDGWNDTPTTNVEIFGNYVKVQEVGNREYATNLEATALRLRSGSSPQRDIHIHDNTFIAKTGLNLTNSAYAGRITYRNRGAMDNAGIVLENNLFHAVTTDDSHSAKAFVLDGASPNIHTDIRNNVFESNHVSLQIVDRDGGGNYDTQFISNTIRKSRAGVDRADYKGIAVGFWVTQADNIELIDTRFEDGVSPEIFWGGSGRKEIATGSLLDVQVVDEQGGALADAAVRLVDQWGSEVFSGTTDATGQIDDIPVVTTVFTQKGTNPRDVSTQDLGSHWIEVSVAGSDRLEQEIRLESSQKITLVIHDASVDPVDVILPMNADKYRTGEPAQPEEGDWNRDGVFDEADIIAALQHRGSTGPNRQVDVPVDGSSRDENDGPAGAKADAAEAPSDDAADEDGKPPLF